MTDYSQTVPLDVLKVLPELPKPNLDDRTYRDLTDECLLRIPRYCPEWTNHNPADPGITLIELFAWLTDQMLWRFNQVPVRQYIAFLELLGVRLAPPKPAETEITFYLSRAQSLDDTIQPIRAGTEVSTERTDSQEAIIFSANYDLAIGIPNIRNFLIANQASLSRPEELGEVRDGFHGWTPEADRGDRWSGREQLIFQPTPQVQNGFYLVLGSEPLPDGRFQSLDGHVIALEIEGQLAGPTGINPKRPPRRWEAWDGESWQSVLLSEEDDETFGFSFDEMGQSAQRGAHRAKIFLHMPLKLPEFTFHSSAGAPYRGFWLRCVYDPQSYPHAEREDGENTENPTYSRSPRFTALAVQAIGGTIPATQCTLVRDELLGASSGKPGQQFSLQSDAILERKPGEHLEVRLPGEEDPQIWTEVSDFADSEPEDRHYKLDSRTGVIQLGPLVREPAQLKTEVQRRRNSQIAGDSPIDILDETDRLQRQYGQVPPKGAILRMTAYRTGGGEVGNVQVGALRILKSAVPYVTRVSNHKAASGGKDAETLDQAVMRVPQLLRTRDRAVTPEDFETLARQASSKVHRARCLPISEESPGRVVVLLVSDQPTEQSPHRRFGLSPDLRKTVDQFLKQRCLLGIAVQTQAPEYVRVKVTAKVLLETAYKHHESVTEEIRQTLEQSLYQFLHPITGGWSGTGWEFGAPLYESDIVSYLHKQKVMGVRSISHVRLFSWDPETNNWLAKGGELVLTPLQLLDSWESDRHPNMGHVVELI